MRLLPNEALQKTRAAQARMAPIRCGKRGSRLSGRALSLFLN
jgi:hypothetical protein